MVSDTEKITITTQHPRLKNTNYVDITHTWNSEYYVNITENVCLF